MIRSDGKPFAEISRSSGSPFDQFHGDEVDVIGFLDRVDRHHVGMIECGDGASLALEAGESIGIIGHRQAAEL